MNKFDEVMKEVKEELEQWFFKGLEERGDSIFNTRRVWGPQNSLDIDDNSFQDELFEYLEEKYNCQILTHSVDMDSFVVLHNDFELDEWGNCTKKIVA